MSEKLRLHLDVVSDVVCPWCYIGKRRLERALALADDVDVSVRWRPFFLNPWIPREGIDRDKYLEAKFGSVANYKGMASQVAQTAAEEGLEYNSARIGRQPLLIMRDGQGRLGAFYNTCRHKGAQVCSQARGNRPSHLCPYHGWAYGSDGRNLAIKARGAGAYSPAFDRDDHGLLPWCFGEIGRTVEPFSDLRLQQPDTWMACEAAFR